jgi:hypothetical protein
VVKFFSVGRRQDSHLHIDVITDATGSFNHGIPSQTEVTSMQTGGNLPGSRLFRVRGRGQQLDMDDYRHCLTIHRQIAMRIGCVLAQQPDGTAFETNCRISLGFEKVCRQQVMIPGGNARMIFFTEIVASTRDRSGCAESKVTFP